MKRAVFSDKEIIKNNEFVRVDHAHEQCARFVKRHGVRVLGVNEFENEEKHREVVLYYEDL
jgi:hypothetical protein